MPHATNILHKQLLHTYTFMQGQFLDVMLGPAVTSHRLISCYDTFSLFLSASFLTSCWTGSLPSATRSTYMPLICRDTSNIMPGRQSSLNYLLFLHATDL